MKTMKDLEMNLNFYSQPTAPVFPKNYGEDNEHSDEHSAQSRDS